MDHAQRFVDQLPEIAQLVLDVESMAPSDDGHVFVAKGALNLGGHTLLTSVVGANALIAVDQMLENFTRQIRRQRRFRNAPPQLAAILPSLPAA